MKRKKFQDELKFIITTRPITSPLPVLWEGEDISSSPERISKIGLSEEEISQLISES